MTRLRMTIPALRDGQKVASPNGSRIWLDGQQHDIVAIELAGEAGGQWQAKITFNVAIEGITQDDPMPSLEEALRLMRVKAKNA